MIDIARGSSPSHVTDQITDSKKTYHAGPIWLLNKTHGSRPDENQNFLERQFDTSTTLQHSDDQRCPLAKSSITAHRWLGSGAYFSLINA